MKKEKIQKPFSTGLFRTVFQLAFIGLMLAGWFCQPAATVAKDGHLPKHRAFAIYTRSAPKIDGKVDKAWLRAPQQSGFTQQVPADGAPATEDTRFYALYDEHNIYFLFIMLDDDPASIPARLVERDQSFYPDDNINFFLDTYFDHRRAYFFSTNARGVERDGLISENGDNVDMSWDGIFDVAARITKYGWVAEFRIPLKTLRFDDSKRYQVWGFNVWRVRKANREKSFWSPVSQNYRTYRLDKGGVLIGMKRIRSGVNLSMLPYVTGRSQKRSGLLRDYKGQTGMDLKYGITTDLTLDLTLNPDFGQVEIDEEQINLDKRFEVQLREKRPFFLENINLFQTPFYQLFYSRRIGATSDIKAGGKLTGKIGPYSVGVLGVSTGNWENGGLGDQNTPPNDELFSVVRVQRDVLNSSNLGAMIVDRESNPRGHHSHFSRAYNVDWSWISGQYYNFSQLVYSTHDTRGKNGGAVFSRAGYYGRTFALDLNTLAYQPDFDIDSTGFFAKIPGKGRWHASLYADMHPLINQHLIRQWGVSVMPTVFKDSDEKNTSYGVQSSAWILTPDESRFSLSFSSYHDVETYFLNYLLPQPRPELAYWGRDVAVEFQSDPGKPVSVRLRWNYDTQYYFQLHGTGYNRGINAALHVKPSSNSFFEVAYQQTEFLDRLRNQLPTALVGQSDIRIYSIRGRYLLTKNIFSRLFAQFTNGAEAPYWNVAPDGSFQLRYQVWDRLSANMLLGWRYLPGSTLYFAYTQEWDRFPGGKFTSANQIFFLKLSYLWSF